MLTQAAKAANKPTVDTGTLSAKPTVDTQTLLAQAAARIAHKRLLVDDDDVPAPKRQLSASSHVRTGTPHAHIPSPHVAI